ncbi:MAG: hypothetical protein L0H63_14390 [Nitrococcus sp.]|nr:hypothetical protein [Nitrococcus sp.]
MRNRLCLGVLILLLLAARPASAEETLYLHLPATEHFPGVSYVTEKNWGIGWTHNKALVLGLRPVAGAYYNSEARFSAYVGVYREWRVNDLVSYGIGGIVVSGYHWAPVVPMPVAFVQLWRVRANVFPGAVNVTLDLVSW